MSRGWAIHGFASKVVSLADPRYGIRKRVRPMKIMIKLLLILIGGGVLFVAAGVLEFIINGVLGYVVVQEPGFGVPFRFVAFGLPMMGSDYFSAARLLLD